MVWLHLNAKPFLKLIEDQCRLRFGAEPNPGNLCLGTGTAKELACGLLSALFYFGRKGERNGDQADIQAVLVATI